VTDIALPTQEQARALTDRIKQGFAEVKRLEALRVLLPADITPKPERGLDERPVYFVQASNGLVKIGVSGSPENRLRTLQTMSPVPLRLLLVLQGGGAHREAELHEQFAEHRSHGEWFRPAPELLAFIKDHS